LYEPSSSLQSSDADYPIQYDQFLTARLWDVGNSAPYGHRGDLGTIFEAITSHGGEASTSEAQYEALSASDQSSVVAFLKTLRMPSVRSDPNPQQAQLK
jgi:HD-like signal output (HDOD) protein